MKVIWYLLAAVFFTLCQTQKDFVPRARIPWRFVTTNSLRIRWTRNSQCATYNVRLLEKYTTTVLQMATGLPNPPAIFSGLDPDTAYGATVQCVDSSGKGGKFGLPGRSRTIGTKTTTPPFTPTGTPPVGACGKDSFTCLDNNCIPAGDWCNNQKDCVNGTDEKNCPGSCKEITEFHEFGNFSCSRFNSPLSACFFECGEDLSNPRVLVGPSYTVCLNGNWTREVPTCLVEISNFGLSALSRTSFLIEFGDVRGITKYRVVSLQTESGEEIRAVGEDGGEVEFVFNSGIRGGVVTGLKRATTYSVVVAGVDKDGVVGKHTERKSVTTAN